MNIKLINFSYTSVLISLCLFYSNKNMNQQQQKSEEDTTAVVMWMERDVIRRLAGESGNACSASGCGGDGHSGSKGAIIGGVALAAPTRNWWSQLKTAGAAIYANRHYLALRQQRQQLLEQEPSNVPIPMPINCRLTSSDPEGGYSTVGNVYVHPSAQVHPSALVCNI